MRREIRSSSPRSACRFGDRALPSAETSSSAWATRRPWSDAPRTRAVRPHKRRESFGICSTAAASFTSTIPGPHLESGTTAMSGPPRWPMPDAGNLAAVLYRLRSERPGTYHGIVETIRQVAPFFTGFDLEPTGAGGKDIILNWRHRESDLVFGPHQLSDGTLRAICLISLLMLPADELPLLIVIDEPELGPSSLRPGYPGVAVPFRERPQPDPDQHAVKHAREQVHPRGCRGCRA